MTSGRAFVALGANEAHPRRHLTSALEALDRDGLRVAACSRLGWSPYARAAGPDADVAPVLNAVAEIRTDLDAPTLHRHLHDLEDAHGRARDGRASRALDLDLLTHGDTTCAGPDLTLPHPRCLERAFVLRPWAEIAPRFVVPGTDRTVVEHAAALAGDPDRTFAPAFPAPPCVRGTDVVVLRDRAALDAWRVQQRGTVGVFMTLGALHAGHAALVRRAVAACDVVVVTLFVNPLQFAPGEDLARYPRTFEADLTVLRSEGVAAVYAPPPADLYPPGFATQIVPAGAALGFEGARRPAHFAGVATVVAKLWQRTRAHKSYFSRKDAQQLAVLQQVRRDLDLGVEIVACPLVREVDGLALSSRNRFLSPPDRARALHLSAALEALYVRAAGTPDAPPVEAERVAAELAAAGLRVEYVAVVDAGTLAPLTAWHGPALAIAAVRVGDVRLIDNRWIAPHAGDRG